MASLMEELMDVLEQENEVYKELLDLSMRKTPVIVSANLDELSSITNMEQMVVSRLGKLEKKREECMNDVANVINRDVNTLKLVDLIDMLKSRPQEQKRLAAIHDALADTLSQMRRANEQNKQLIESSLELVQFDLTVLQSMKAAPETANYTKNAYASGNMMGTGRPGFDSKS